MFHLCEKSILRKNLVIPMEKFSSLAPITQECDNVTVATPSYPICATLLSNLRPIIYLSRVFLWEVKNKRNFQMFSSKSGWGRLQGVVPLKEFPNIAVWLGTFSIFENWSLIRGGCNWAFDCIIYMSVYDQRIQPYCHRIVLIMNFNYL